MRWLETTVFVCGSIIGILGIVVNALALYVPEADDVTYGATFSVPYARELGIDWKAAFNATLTDLNVRDLRLVAYWDEIEKNRGEYDFTELDYQIETAALHNAEAIVAVGRRVPRWPECHVPEWATALPKTERQDALLHFLEAVITRYKDSPHITHWQVENEPYLEVFAQEECGALDRDFLKSEIAFVRALDPDTPILITDSGNLGTWWEPYRLGDAFGTSVYRYFWHPDVGQFTSIIPADWYRVRHAALDIIFGDKPFFLIELSGEPWLTDPIIDTPLAVQRERMNLELFNETLAFAKETGFTKQYLWGVEWWYWLANTHNDPALWNRARALF